MAEADQERLFPALTGDDSETAVTVIQSLCVSCEEQGESRLMLTNIPFFRDIIIASFSCPHCGYSNRSVDTAGMIEEKGIRFELRVRNVRDLSRQIVTTEVSEMRLPELESSFPIGQGKLTTIEGTIQEVIDNLRETMQSIRESHPEVFTQLAEFIAKLHNLLLGETEFDWILEDPRGSSFVENLNAPEPDEYLKVSHFERSAEQNKKLGLDIQSEPSNGDVIADAFEKFDMKDEVVEFPVNCPSCNAPCMNRMKTVDIPHFKEVILMAMTCDACGLRDTEVKPGAGIAEKGRKIVLRVTDATDLSRDLLKSETCSLSIPELELEAMKGTLGGKFTTVEGMLVLMKDQLKSINPFVFGDSSKHPAGEDELGAKLRFLVSNIDEAIAGEKLNYTIIMDDPAGNSFVQNLYAPDPDPEMTIEDYERSAEQNEELGIDGMIV